MFYGFCNGINGFRNAENSCARRGNPTSAASRGAYGSIYNTGSHTFTVALPGDIIPITFDSNALLGRGVIHVPESADVLVCCSGSYEIDFALFFTASAAAFSTFSLEKNEEALPGGIFSKMLETGYQIYSGATMAALSAGDIIRLVFTAPLAIDINLTGNDVTAYLNIKKL